MESPFRTDRINHMAGIIPVGGQPLEFNMPWHDSLMPLNKDFLAIEKSVYECALFGCETIWIVGHYGTQPLIKKRIGEFVFDPRSHDYLQKRGPNRAIPIYYVAINPKDMARRDCLGWSVLYGARQAYNISNFMSKWIIPQNFYCSFPYGVVDKRAIINTRSEMTHTKKVVFKHKDKTVKDNLHISFMFDSKDYFACRDIVRQRDLKEWVGKKDKPSTYDLATVFKGLDFSNAELVELPSFHDISTWEGYRTFLASEENKYFARPKKFFTRFKKRKYAHEQERGEDLQSNESDVQE